MAYTKTNWVNGTTPINATNLNHIEDGIESVEQEIPEVKTANTSSATATYSCNYINNELNGRYKAYELYSGDTTSAFTLSDNIANYNYVEIIFHTNDGAGVFGSTKVMGGSGNRTANALYFWYVGGSIYVKSANIKLNGTSGSFDNNYQWQIGGSIVAGNYIYVNKVIGYK